MPESREFRIVKVLADSVGIYVRSLPAYFVLGLIAVVPVVIHIFTVEPAQDVQDSVDAVGMISGLLLGNLVTAAVIFGVVNQLGGNKPSFLRCVGAGLRFALPVLVVAIATGALIGLGVLLLVVPGVYLACLWFVAVPAAVVERLRVGQAMERSSFLTEGRRGRIFVLVLIQFGSFLLLSTALYTWALPDEYETWEAWRLWTAFTEILLAVFTTFFSVVVGVAYHALRVEKEGVSIEDLLEVFE